MRLISVMQLWAVMLVNSSELFVHQSTESKVLDTLQDVFTSQRTPFFVRENLRVVIDAAARASHGTSYECQSRIRMLWRTIKPVVKLDEVGLSPAFLAGLLNIERECFFQCVPFGADVSMVNPPSPWRSTVDNPTPRHPLMHPQSLHVQSSVPPDIGSTRFQYGSDEDDDRAPSEQSTWSANGNRPTFECCICMEGIPVDSIAHPDSRGHAGALFDEYEFIILCPTCNAAKYKEKVGGTQGGM
jgi:hypothetical protein